MSTLLGLLTLGWLVGILVVLLRTPDGNGWADTLSVLWLPVAVGLLAGGAGVWKTTRRPH